MTHHPRLCKPTPGERFVYPAEGGATNVEMRPTGLTGFLTPIDRFYVRSHFDVPELDTDTWRLTLEGDALVRSLELDLAALTQLPRVSVVRAIECAGNARAGFARDFGRAAEGAQWHTGAIGVAEWTGVRLRDVLELAGIAAEAAWVLPEGLDGGRFARPLPIDKALTGDTIIALAMNGEPLPVDHGFPARLVVPGWLGAASVKWLGHITVSRGRLDTYWNTRDYTLAGPDYPAVGDADGIPITTMPVMSLIECEENATFDAGRRRLFGRAFSGEGPITAVACRLDDGPWQPAALEDPGVEGAWALWSIALDLAPGEHVIHVRAVDATGAEQPDQVVWNDHGCLYNAVTRCAIDVI
ncbi:sulfite oxidase [Salinicola halophilus]|uniref:sulfite oxidase n=1 Tax=Salinicola halophilus TaxID=184065 RepID=UPI0019550F17|nr:sulfite oxidase [Salinicola halophilus]